MYVAGIVASRAYTCFALVHFQDLPKENVENNLQVCRTREDTRGLLDGGSYKYNELTYFFLAACVLHNCEIQFDLQKGCEPAGERPCKCA